MLDGLNQEQSTTLQEGATERIRETMARIHYAESRRSGFSALALGLVVAGVALLAGLLANSNHISFRPGLWTLFATGIGVIATGIVVLLLYAAQTNFNYPFKSAVPTWKWFYRDAIPEVSKVDTPWHRRLPKSRRAAAEETFREAWKSFGDREVTLIDQRTSTQQDIQQLFVLYANEFYKNRFLTQLRQVLQIGVSATAAAAIIVLVWTWSCGG